MYKLNLSIPSGIKKLSDGLKMGWDLDQHLPVGDVIVNKVVCGCGMTTLYLENDLPVIVVSPRNELIHSKMNDERINGKGELFFFDRRDYKKILLSQTQMDMIIYLKSHPNSPKILVTYDSLGEVLNCLDYHGKLSKFTIIIDEFTSLFTDALMKGDAEFKLVQQVSTLPNRVVYISATPIDEQYLDQIPEFANLPYVTFNWDASCIEKVTIKKQKMKSAVQQMGEIIDGFQGRGYFQAKIIGDKPYYSTEVAFFVNRVTDIASIIKKKCLSPNEVRVICSNDESNRKVLAKVGVQIDHFPSLAEYQSKIKTYTFVTKTAYVGSDYYSDSATICIFADSNRNEMALDISLELPQIIGRCRTGSNIFRHDILYFYKTTNDNSSPDESSRSEIEKEIREKYNSSMADYNNPQYKTDKRIIKWISDSHTLKNFKESYLTVENGQLWFNRLVYIAEMRALDIKYSQYNSSQSIEGFIMRCGYDVQNLRACGNSPYAKFRQWWDGTHDFSKRMEIYLTFMAEVPELIDVLRADCDIPIKYWKYATVLGPDVCKANSYKEAALERELERKHSTNSITTELIRRLDPTIVYPKSELKGIIQSVYDGLGISANAKAIDIARYLPVQEISYTETVDGKPKKRRGFQVNINCQVYHTPVTIFPRVNDTKNARDISLGQVLLGIRSGIIIDGTSIVETINKYRTTKIVALKESLPVVMWQGVFSERNDDHCRTLNSIICLDFDHVPANVLSELRTAIKTVPFVIASFLSPGGEGLKVLIKTDITDIQTYKNCYVQLERWFKAHYNLEADPNCRPLSQPCLLSYDPELYFNPSPSNYHYEFDHEIEAGLKKTVKSLPQAESISYNPSYEQFINKLNVAKNGLSDEEIIEILNYRFHASPIYYEEGHREKSIGIQAMTLNKAGISLDKAIYYLRENFKSSGYPMNELEIKVRSEYHRNEGRYGSERGIYMSRKKYFQQSKTTN